jgi:flagellar protein FliL
MLRRVLLPAILGLAGLGTGVGTGLFFRPPSGTEADTSDTASANAEVLADATGHGNSDAADEGHSGTEGDAPEYVKLNNQFVVPVVEDGLVSAMVVLSLSLEVEPGNTESVYQREPKLRDVFLQVMFDHANTGGFSGSFTDGSNLVVLRTSLKEAAAMVLGTTVRDVLITDIARQDS